MIATQGISRSDNFILSYKKNTRLKHLITHSRHRVCFLNRLETEGKGALTRLVSVRSREADRDGRYYLLVDAAGRKLAGNLFAWPPDSPIPYDGSVHTVWVEDNIIPGQKYNDDAFWPVVAMRFGDGSCLLVARSVQQAEALLVRLDSARSTAGNGLGLSLVSAIARLHHAELQLSDNQPGLRVELRLERSRGHLDTLSE